MIVLRRKKYAIAQITETVRASVVKTRLRLVLFLMSVMIFVFLCFVSNEKSDVDHEASSILDRPKTVEKVNVFEQKSSSRKPTANDESLLRRFTVQPPSVELSLPTRNEINPKDAVWQTVHSTKSEFAVYSAYLDTRIETVGPLIRIIGAADTENPDAVWCRLWYANGSKTVSAYVYNVREHWDLKCSAVFVLCKLPPGEDRPSSVSVVSNVRNQITNELFVHTPKKTGEFKTDVEVCVKPFRDYYYTTGYPDVHQTSRPSTSGNVRREGLCNGQVHSSRDYESPESSVTSDRDRQRTVYEIQVRPCAGIVLVVIGVVVLLIWIAVPSTPEAPGSFSPRQEETLEVVRRILEEVPLIDGHNDLPWNIRKFVHNQLMYFNFSTDLTSVEPWSKSNWSQTDLPRLKKGMVGAQFWSAYVPCGRQHLDVVQTTMEQIDVIRRLAETYSSDLQLVTSVKGIREAHKARKIASLIGVEGGHSLGNSLAVLRIFHSLGARYLTLTHTCDTLWAGCCSGLDSPENEHQGLSPFGLLVLRELNRLGMMVDLSHTSVKTMEDALNYTLAPVIFSHSCAYALCTSLRNVPDHVLKLVALNDGIIMVSFYSYFISCNSTSTMEQVIAHINHIKNVAGEDHVGLGAGYDGINHTTQGLEDVSHYPQLLSSLMSNHSWTEDQIKKLAGNNLLRVFSKVEKVRDEWKEDGMKPVEDILVPLNKEPLLPNCTDGYNMT